MLHNEKQTTDISSLNTQTWHGCRSKNFDQPKLTDHFYLFSAI